MEVFTFGNGDYLTQIFLAIRGLMGASSFQALVTILIIVSLFWAYWVGIFSGRGFPGSSALKVWFVILLVYWGLFVPKVDVVIHDEIRNTDSLVQDVPWGVGFFAHFFTSAEKGVAKLFDTYFTIPSDLKYTTSGMGFGLLGLDTASESVILDPYLRRTVDEYIANCFFADVLMGNKDLNQVVYSNDLLTEIASSNTAFTSKIYDSAHPSGQSDTCANVYAYIQGELSNHVSSRIAPLFASKVMGLSSMNNLLAAQVLNRLGVAGNYLLNLSLNGQQILTQAVLMNAMSDGMRIFAAKYGTDSDALGYALAMASQQTRTSWSVSSELAKKYIPVIRQVIEALVYGTFPLLFLIMLTPLGGAIFRTYLTLLLWLLLWSPLFSILNLIVMVRAVGVLSPYAGTYSLAAASGIMSSTVDMIALAGSLSWMVPILALAIASGSQYAMVHLFGGVAGTVQGAAGQVASQVSTPGGVAGLQAQAQTIQKNEALRGSMGLDPARVLQAEASWNAAPAAAAYYSMMGIGAGRAAAAFAHNTAHTVGRGLGLGSGATSLGAGQFAGAREAGVVTELERMGSGVTDTARGLARIEAAGMAGRVGMATVLTDEQLRNVEAGKLGNEVAKFEMINEIGRRAFPEWQGYSSFYEALKAHQGYHTLVLSDEQAKTLMEDPNARGGKYLVGLSTDGRIQLVAVESGISEERVLSAQEAKKLFGSQAPGGSYNIYRDRDGKALYVHADSGQVFRMVNENGAQDIYRTPGGQAVWVTTNKGVLEKVGVFGRYGKDLDYTRVVRGALHGPDGKVYQGEYYYDDKGRILAGSLRNTINGETVSLVATDKNGRVIPVKNFDELRRLMLEKGVGKDGIQVHYVRALTTYDSKGEPVVRNLTEVSRAELERDGFKTDILFAHGDPLYQSQVMGRDRRLADTEIRDHTHDMRGGAGAWTLEKTEKIGDWLEKHGHSTLGGIVKGSYWIGTSSINTIKGFAGLAGGLAATGRAARGIEAGGRALGTGVAKVGTRIGETVGGMRSLSGMVEDFKYGKGLIATFAIKK